eukprot:TRINITY_DN320_c0_g1_i1.p1 TRINITY_DN320_c0_g1~~TRINITY_DN320_c0_g1_i1.p1  ORF type:complete len:384 (+),score=116.33 TRINITY_DN320_c0_g1_i1:41-1153(+)
MKAILLLLAIYLVLCYSKTTWDQLDNYKFEQYKQEFKKNYANAQEEEMRRKIFEKKIMKIRRHNQDSTKTWKEGVNHLSDRTPHEINRMRGHNKNIAAQWKHSREEGYNYVKQNTVQLPDTVDWRTKGVISAVKDQGECGSCWTFGSTESIESHYALKYGSGLLTDLSEQQILDCIPNPDGCGGTGGCLGGVPELVYEGLMKTGITTEWMYPYVSYFGANFTCKVTPNNTNIVSYAQIQNYTKLPSNNYEAVITTLATTGPLAINVAAAAWVDYESGIYTGCPQTNVDIDHVVLLVGYGVENGSPYWLVRNSWSPKWGDEGYIKLYRHTSAFCGIDYSPQDGTGCNNGPKQVTVCGSCGILYDVSYPIIA